MSTLPDQTYKPEIATYPSPLPSWDGKQLILEIGPGRGDFLFQLAEENPDHLVFAIEYKNKRFEKLITRIEKRKLTNVVLIKGEAHYVLKKFLKEILFEKVFILFPDPWPKKRHAKHRLIESKFLNLLTGFMRPQGELVAATDDKTYAGWMEEEFAKVPTLKKLSSKEPHPKIFETFFAEKWKKMGRKFHVFYLGVGK